MFRLIVIGKNEVIAKEAAEWAVQGEKMGDSFEKKYDIAGRSLAVKALPVWNGYGMANPVGDGLAVIAKGSSDLFEVEELVKFYRNMPIKFIIYDGPGEQKDLEAKWGAKGTMKKTPSEFVEQIIGANNDLVKLIAGVFKNFDKDNSGYIEIREIVGIAKELGSDIPEDEAQQMIAEMDANQDGRISMEEFVEWWKTGRKEKGNKMGGLVSNWLQNNPILKMAIESASKAGAAPGEKNDVMTSSFTVHVNKVVAPGISFETKIMTKGKELDSAFQTYANAVGVTPAQPFIGLALGTKNPAVAREKLEELINGVLMMAGAMIPQASMALDMIDRKFGVTANKTVLCAVPSAAASATVDQVMSISGPLFGLIKPDQFFQFFLTFATDLEKLISEDKPFFELLLDGFTMEINGQMRAQLNQEVHSMLKQPGLSPFMPSPLRHALGSMLRVDQWLQGAKGELVFEVDQELKNLLKETVGPNPAAMPLKDLKMMMGPQMKAMLEDMPPMVDQVYKLFKDEVDSLELFIHVCGAVAFKITLSLPGLEKFLSLD